MFSTKTQKERKGLGTSPFGPVGLTTVPIPCVSIVFLERPRRRFRRCRRFRTAANAASHNAQPVAPQGRSLFSVLRSPFSVALQRPTRYLREAGGLW